MINLDSLPPSAHNLDLGPILARAEAASDAYFDHLAPRCSYTSAGDGMGCGLSSGHDGPHVMLIPRADGWRYVNEARTDIPALCAEVARLRAALSWQESRHGTQAEQEREEAETAAEMDAIDAMSEEQVSAELREAGIDVEAGRETCEALVRVALERNRLRGDLAEAHMRLNLVERAVRGLRESSDAIHELTPGVSGVLANAANLVESAMRATDAARGVG